MVLFSSNGACADGCGAGRDTEDDGLVGESSSGRLGGATGAEIAAFTGGSDVWTASLGGRLLATGGRGRRKNADWPLSSFMSASSSILFFIEQFINQPMICF